MLTAQAKAMGVHPSQMKDAKKRQDIIDGRTGGINPANVKDEIKEVIDKETKKQAESKGISTADDDSSQDVTSDIQDVTYNELRKKAKELGIKLFRGITKTDIIKLITEKASNQKG